MKVQWWCYSSRRIITLYWRTIGPFRCWVMYINWFSGSLQIVSNEGSMTSSHPGKPGSEKVTILWTYILWQVIIALGLWESLWFRQNLGGAWISPTITNWLKLFVWKSHYVSLSTWIEFEGDSLEKRREKGRCYVFKTAYCRTRGRLQAPGMDRNRHQYQWRIYHSTSICQWYRS